MADPFFPRLEARARRTGSLLCVGLDPHPELLPEPTAEAAEAFCRRLIEATAEVALAYKPNSAFFEALGPEGWAALQRVIRAVPDGVPVILDAKRGDIASTARAYARAVFEGLGVDAVTLSPYLGPDALEPFLAYPDRGVFLLCKTSNPGADVLQSLAVQGEPLYLHLARLAEGWGPPEQLGLVVGATDPTALAAVRAAAPQRWILAPGVGAQGGDLRAALAAGLRADGLGLVLPVSRALARAADPAAEARRLAVAFGEGVRRAPASEPLPPALAALADGLLEAGCVHFGRFTLKSGHESPIYFDLRLLASHPRLLTQAADAYLPLLRALTFDRLAAVPYAGLPIGTAVSLRGGWPLVYPRKEVKAYGTQKAVEGAYRPGERAVLLDDLATTGGSKFEAVERLQAAGLEVRDVVVLIDRQGGAAEALAERGLRLHAVLRLTDLLAHWEGKGRIDAAQARVVRAFLDNS